jgi:hypothetical protein
MPTENLISFFEANKAEMGLRRDKLQQAMKLADEVFIEH